MFALKNSNHFEFNFFNNFLTISRKIVTKKSTLFQPLNYGSQIVTFTTGSGSFGPPAKTGVDNKKWLIWTTIRSSPKVIESCLMQTHM